MKRNLPGIILSLLIAVPAWFTGQLYPLVGGPVLAILCGMVISMFLKMNGTTSPGLKLTSKKMLQGAIILLGFQLNLANVAAIGSQALLLILLTLVTAFLTAFIVSKIIKTEENTSILIGVGTAICGGSAIAATAPIIGAREEEIASSISTIFLFNIVAVLVFPPLGRWLGMSDFSFGLWAGTAINDTSSVVAAGQIWSDTALQTATIVKLVRTLGILPIAIALGFRQAKKDSEGQPVNISTIFPWFIMGFLVASLMATQGIVPPQLQQLFSFAGKFMIVMAMAAIGLSTNIVQLVHSGKKPLFLGFCCWSAVVVASLIAQRIMG